LEVFHAKSTVGSPRRFHRGPRHNGKGAVDLPRLPLSLLGRADVIKPADLNPAGFCMDAQFCQASHPA
jgi:hypothetical protein